MSVSAPETSDATMCHKEPIFLSVALTRNLLFLSMPRVACPEEYYRIDEMMVEYEGKRWHMISLYMSSTEPVSNELLQVARRS